MTTDDLDQAFAAVPYEKRDHGACRALKSFVQAGEKIVHLDLNCPIKVDIFGQHGELGPATADIFAITDQRLVAFGHDYNASGVPGVQQPLGYIILEIRKGDVSSITPVPVPQLDGVTIHVAERGRIHAFEWFVLGREKPVMKLLQTLM